MNFIWQKISFIACLGFTLLMAGANLAHMTATAKGAPVPFLGTEIPQRTIMAVGALCVDVVIIVAPFALQHRHTQRQHARFFVVLAIWLACSLVSIRSVHDWLAEAAAVNAAPAAAAERQFRDIESRLETAKKRLKTIQETLLRETDYDKRKILISEERKTRDEISSLEPRFWQAQVVPAQTPDDTESWVRAVILWALSVGCWMGFLGDDQGEDGRELHPKKSRYTPKMGGSPNHQSIGEVITKGGSLGSNPLFHMKQGPSPNEGDADHPSSPDENGGVIIPFPPSSGGHRGATIQSAPHALVVAGDDRHTTAAQAIVMENNGVSAVMEWAMKHTQKVSDGSFRPSDAWSSFVANGYGKGYAKEMFYTQLKVVMQESWKRTKTGVVYKGVKLL